MRHEAIRALYANVVTIDDGTGAFDKDGNKVTIDEDAVTTKANELTAANAYIGKRINAYPQLAEQLDMLYKDIELTDSIAQCRESLSEYKVRDKFNQYIDFTNQV